jgi:hypothetical protein
MRRLRRRFPEAVLVAGVWGAERDNAVLAALREEGSGFCEARSLRDAVVCLVEAAAGGKEARTAAGAEVQAAGG